VQRRRKTKVEESALLSDAEIAKILAVEETDSRMGIVLVCAEFSVALDGLKIGVGESTFDTFARCIAMDAVSDGRSEMLLKLDPTSGRCSSDRRVERYLTSPPPEDLT